MNVLPLFATMLMQDVERIFSRGVSPLWIPIVGTIFGTAMVVAIVGIVVHHKQQMQRLEFELHMRRMDHERRMKELELELVRVRESRGAGTPAT